MKRFWMDFMAVGAAGFVGAVLRFVIGRWLNTGLFPWGTLLINISGSFMLGWFMAFILDREVSETLRLAIAVGFVGTFTTFSTLMYEGNNMFRDGSNWLGLGYFAGSMVLGLAAVKAGVMLGAGH